MPSTVGGSGTESSRSDNRSENSACFPISWPRCVFPKRDTLDGEVGRFLKARSILVNASRAAAARSSAQDFGKGSPKMSFFPTLSKTSRLYPTCNHHKSLFDLCVQTEQIYVEGVFEFSRT